MYVWERGTVHVQLPDERDSDVSWIYGKNRWPYTHPYTRKFFLISYSELFLFPLICEASLTVSLLVQKLREGWREGGRNKYFQFKNNNTHLQFKASSSFSL